MTKYHDPNITTVEYVHDLMTRGQNLLLEQAERACTAFSVSFDICAVLRSLAGIENALPDLIASNMPTRLEIAHTQAKLLAHLFSEQGITEFAPFRIDDQASDTTSDRPVLDQRQAQKPYKSAVRKLSENSVTTIRPKILAGTAHRDGGEIISQSAVGIAWGPGLHARLAKELRKVQQKFRSRSDDIQPIEHRIVPVNEINLAIASAEMWGATPPRRVASIAAKTSGEGKEVARAMDDARAFRQMHLHMVSPLPKLSWAFGDGEDIARRSFAQAKAKLVNNGRRVETPVHRDGIIHMLAEIAIASGNPALRPPLFLWR
jgi:hypothetical protein